MNRRRRNSSLFVLAALLLITAATGVLAGTTGKIVGKVIDAKTGEGLPGANVVLVGTKMGAATDVDGSYVIINVQVGTYSVQATMIGFKGVTATGVRSIQDLTTRQDFKLEMTAMAVPGITIISQPLLVVKDATNTTRITTRKEIEAMPVQRPQDVVAVTAGAVGSGNNINIRGGRRDEVSYFVDGLSINDAVVGGAGLNVNKLAIQEVMVQTGGFSAEYGEALSGIVNVVTKEGSDKVSGVLRMTSDQFLGPLSNHYNLYEGSVGGPVPGIKALKYYFSGELSLTDNRRPMFLKDSKIWERVPVQLNADGRPQVDASQLHGGSQWWNSTTPWVWADTLAPDITTGDSLFWTQADRDSMRAGAWDRVKARRIAANVHDGWKQTDRKWYNPADQESYRTQAKLSYSFNPNMKVILGGNASRDQYIPLYYDDNDLGFEHWKYKLAQDEAELDKGLQANLTWRHQIGKRTFYTASVNHFETSVMRAPLNLVKMKDRSGKWWKDYNFLSDADANGDGIFDDFAGLQTQRNVDDNPYGIGTGSIFYGADGVGRVFLRRYEAYWGFKGDYTTQLGKVGSLHEIRGGLEGKQWRMDMKQNSLPWDPNAFRDYYVKRHPRQGAAYLQDKMEFEGLVVNTGLRFDYLDANTYYLKNWFLATPRTASDTTKVSAKYQFSPRLGISHPVSDRTVLHFSYGQFFQQPELQYLYNSLAANISSPTWVGRGNQVLGDPNQGAQKTIQYETGFSQQLSADVATDFTFYYKDIQGYSGTHLEIDPTNIGTTVSVYENVDYGNVRGFEVTLQKRPGSGILSGKLSYSLSVAKGSASYPAYSYYETYYGYPLTKTDQYLDFDQRHTISNDLNLELPATFGPKVANNRVLGNINLNFLTSVGSGLPFTPTDSRGTRTGDYNSGRLPWTMQSDMLVTKNLKVLGLGAELSWEIINLFNRKNVVDVYSYTGSPIDNGQTFSPDLPSFSEQKEFLYNANDSLHVHPIPNASYNKLRDLNHDGTMSRSEAYSTYMAAYQDMTWNPLHYGQPRQMRLRFGIQW